MTSDAAKGHHDDSFAANQFMKGLSDHLFWDVDRASVDPDKHSAWLAKRVLDYGRWSDWRILADYYSKPGLADLITGLRDLNPRSLAFCCAWFQLPPSAFRCSSTTPSPMR